jgi:hypothetical protein
VEFRAASSERFELNLEMTPKPVSKRIHPFAGVWVRASIPLRYYRQGLGNGSDLAATVNQPRNSYWINIESGGYGPVTNVQGMSVTMRYPVGAPTLEIRSVTLATNDPGDDVLEGKPLIDEFGQYAHAEWPGKAHSEEDLQKSWAAEADALKADGTFPGRDIYGGFADTKAKATGFFRGSGRTSVLFDRRERRGCGRGNACDGAGRLLYHAARGLAGNDQWSGQDAGNRQGGGQAGEFLWFEHPAPLRGRVAHELGAAHGGAV